MLKHLHDKGKMPHRVVVLGANGFVGNGAIKHLLSSGINVLPLSRNDIDLVSPTAATLLSEILDIRDSLLFVSAKAPVKNNQMLVDNLKMVTSVCEALHRTSVAHLVYISSDAVYADSDDPLTEESIIGPDSLHGVMHLAREVMLKQTVEIPTCILRPTLIYGPSDPHNGYGPNRFIRQALAGEKICLFGSGEEQRDHVWIEDVASTIFHVLFHKSVGPLNVCSGNTVSFAEIAEMVLEHTASGAAIKFLPRSGPMPHKGYRPFNASLLINAFPKKFAPVRPLLGIQSCIKDFRQTD